MFGSATGRKGKSPTLDVQPWERGYDNVANHDDIYHCFRLLLGRSPNIEEWPGHSSRVGENLTSVVSSYVNSLEFSRRDLLKQNYYDDLVRKEFDGFRMWVPRDDLALGKWLLAGEYEPGVTAVFRRVLGLGMGVIDIGANIGWYTMLSAALVGATGRVFAIEPNPDNAKLIEASRRENGFGHVTVVQAAAGAEIGLLALNTSHSNGTTSAIDGELGRLLGATTVPCLKLDDIIPGEVPISLIKADVEGAEYLALQGCSGTILNHRPIIISEFAPNMMRGISGVDGLEYLEKLIGFHYRLSVIGADGALTPCGKDAARVMDLFERSGIDHIDLCCEPDRLD